MNFAQWLALSSDDCPAIKADDGSLSYADLEAAVATMAGALRGSGVRRGDRVGVQIPTAMAFPIAYLAVLRLGAVVVPLNPLLRAPEVAFQLSDSGTTLVVAADACADVARDASERASTDLIVDGSDDFGRLAQNTDPVSEVVPREDNDAAVIIYTSGTTGTPKGAALTHQNLAVVTDLVRELLAVSDRTVSVVALPLTHVFGMTYLNVTLRAGGLLRLIGRFDAAKVLSTIARDQATLFAGVPTMYTQLLDCPERDQHDVSTLSVCVSGGAALPVEVLRGIDELFGVEVLEGYGLSESTGVACLNRRDRPRKLGSIGVPVPGAEVKLIDDDGSEVPDGKPGELLIRAPFVMKGYWQRDDATRDVLRDGWLHTGDIATVDVDGYYFIVDRKKEMIVRGGYNVYPREIEEVLYQHPAVSEVAVVGVPHRTLGQDVAAAIVLKEGKETDAEELREYAKARVAAYKYPRHVWLTSELPKGPTGKILKRDLVPPEMSRAEAG